MHFGNPLALLLLFTLPLLVYLGPVLRGAAGRREILSVSLRLIIAASLILALAGFQLVRQSNRLAVWFLLDGSDSIPPQARSGAEAIIQASLLEMGPDDQAGIIVFGRQPVVERPLSSSRDLGVLRSSPDRDQSNLESAIRLALALLPPDAARRIVLLSDGVQTVGNADTAARLAASAGVQIVAIPLTNEHESEVMLTEISAPAQLREGEQFELQVSLEASQPDEGQLRVFANGQLIHQGSQRIERGQQTFSLPLQANQALANSGRFIRYRIEYDSQRDSYYQNNQGSAYSLVDGPPRLLVIAPTPGERLPFRGGTSPTIRPDEAAQLIRVLSEAGYQYTSARPSGLPDDLAELANYDGVILIDVPARELSGRQMEAVQSYVRDLGGGLLAIGGPTSFGVGGYYRTPLEEALPVEMQMKDQLRRPNLTILFVIDHSGSMGEVSGGVSKLELAKEAAIRSIELLTPSDRTGVIAFDESASWVVPITDLSNPESVISRIAGLRDGGGTDILAGLQAMADALPADPASVKHVILLTDGGANPAGIPELVTRMNVAFGITLTTVGIGSDAAPYLANLAELGGGRYHFAADPGAIPRIFTEETSLAVRSYIIERTFTPIQTGSSPILAGLAALPVLRGYIGTTPRPVAQTLLVSDLNDPILAVWQYGLGRTAAFTSDASGRWASDWINWQGFPGFWTQTVQFILASPTRSALTVRVEPEAGDTRLVVDARTNDGIFLNGYQLQANVATPDGQIVRLDLVQTAPGQYESVFTAQTEGAYLIGITGQPLENTEARSTAGQGNQPLTVAETAGWVRPYSTEYRQLNTQDSQELASLAELTGGWSDAGEVSGKIFAHNLPSGIAATPAWSWFLLLAVFLLPIDIAIRRLALTTGDLKRALINLANWKIWEPARAGNRAEQEQTASLTAFMRAKQRVGQHSERQDEQSASLDAASMQAQEPTHYPTERPGSAASQAKQPSEGDEETQEPAARERTTAANLLAAKRKRKKNSDHGS